MNIERSTHLRDIANAGDAARLVLDRAGLDYCCDGDRRLDDACGASGLATEAIEAELRAARSEVDGDRSHREISAVLDSVLTECHPRTKRLLSEATAAALAFSMRAPSTRPLADALGALASHASKQMREEEETLYARVRALADARMGRGPYPLPPFRTIHEHGERLREGHRQTHAYIRRVRALLAQIEVVGSDDVRARTDAALGALMLQMHLENNELLPLARDLEPNESSAGV